MIISTAKNMSIDPDIIKLMTGKAVDKAMLPYLRTIDVKTAFTRLQTLTGLNIVSFTEGDQTKAMQETLAKFENALSKVESENSTLKFRFEQQQTQNAKLTQRMEKAEKNLTDFLNCQQSKWDYQQEMDEIYFDYGYDSETQKQATDEEVEKEPQACKAILEILEEYSKSTEDHIPIFGVDDLRVWKEYLLHPEKRAKIIKESKHWRHWRSKFI